MPRSLLFLVSALLAIPGALEAGRFPNVVFVTIDTLRADRIGAYGYHRPTTPEIDDFLDRGARFDEARTIEPLTAPALASMLTSIHPHEHGSTRNGLPVREGLASVSAILEERGFATAAFVGNWTLKRELSGLGEHFQTYEEVLSRKRWFIIKGEATARDLTRSSLSWLDRTLESRPHRPFFLWVHYVEPHAPYLLQEETLGQLGFPEDSEDLAPRDRYDTEVAFVDAAVGRLLDGIYRKSPPEETLVVLTSDHGESLGEHGYWGHGRNLYEEGLRIPLGIVWPGVIPAGTVISEPATILDLAPTVLGLLDHPVPDPFRGFDWTGVLRDGQSGPEDRTILLQAHKGAVQPVEDPEEARRRGLLSVGILESGRKEIFRTESDEYLLFDLRRDPEEEHDLAAEEPDSPLPAPLRAWWETVDSGLELADDLPAPALDAEAEEQLRALGYIE